MKITRYNISPGIVLWFRKKNSWDVDFLTVKDVWRDGFTFISSCEDHCRYLIPFCFAIRANALEEDVFCDLAGVLFVINMRAQLCHPSSVPFCVVDLSKYIPSCSASQIISSINVSRWTPHHLALSLSYPSYSIDSAVRKASA